MANLQVYKYLSATKFPIRDKYISFFGNFNNFNRNVKRKLTFLNDHFKILLKKNKKEQEESDLEKKYELERKAKEEQKKNEIKLEIRKKVKMLLDRQKLKSITNNKMLLDIMATNKEFVNYINKQKTIKNNIKSTNSESALTLKVNSKILTKFKKRNYSSTFLTEIKSLNNTKNLTLKIQNKKMDKIKTENLFNTKTYEQNGRNKFKIKLKNLRLNKQSSNDIYKSMPSKENEYNNNFINFFRRRANFSKQKNKSYKSNLFIFNDNSKLMNKLLKNNNRYNSENPLYKN